MRLAEITLRKVRLPLIRPYVLSYRTFEEFEPIIVEVRDPDGRVGWGEGHISPGSSSETREAGWAFCYEHAKKIADAVAKYKNADGAARRKMVADARKLLKKEHNVGSLLSENGKLEKTRIGDYNLQYEGNPVASQGLGLASAQKLSEKVSTCPRSAICEGLCLGETSGGNFMFGGAATEDVGDIQKSSFRAAARMMQYLKTDRKSTRLNSSH